MKRYLILTSVLALAACGGGSSGVSDNLSPAQRAAIESNKNITGMLTYLETDGSGNTIVGRGASTRNSGIRQMAGTYDLSDVKFANIDEDFEDVGEDDGFQFVVDENHKIVGFNVGLKELDDYPLADSEEPEFVRNGDDSNKFTGLVNTDDGWVDGELEYNSFGKGVGLRYSDFGNMMVKNLASGELQQRLAFIGGYDDAKKINEINDDTTFAGVATGSVVAIKEGPRSGKFLNLDTSANSDADRQVATLNFNNGTSTLVAKFDNWYDLTYVKNGNDKSITFSNYFDSETDVNGVAVDPGTFRMINDNGNETFTVNSQQYEIYEDGNPTGAHADSLNSEFRAFGDNGNPSEAVGLVQIRDSDDYSGNMLDYDTHHEVRMNLGFGGKAQ